jgi:proteic killer suppression protein
MIFSFKDKDLKNCYETGNCRRIRQDLVRRTLRKLEILDAATCLDDLRSPPGNRLHGLEGDRKEEHAIAVNGPWRITFKFESGNAHDVALEQYH